jgi:WD40 repeat protein
MTEAGTDRGAQPAPLHDLFVSYRRMDGATLAGWLVNRVRRYRLPLSLDAKQTRKAAVFLDTDYERASDDFWAKKIVPNLKRSQHLLVIVTPAALEQRTDGKDNWVVQEIAEFFSSGGDSSRVLVALGPGASPERLPRGLERSQRWDWIDLRRFSSVRALWPASWDSLDHEVVKLLARVFEVPDEHLPELRNQEGRRRARILRWAVAAALALAGVMSILTVWALSERSRAETARRAAESRALAEQGARAALLARQAGGEAQALALAIDAATRVRGSEPGAAAAVTEGLSTALSRFVHPVADLSHEGRVFAAAFSPDGGRVVTAGDAGAARLWDGHTGAQIRSLAHDGPVCSAAFSADGRWILTRTFAGELAVWDAEGKSRRARHATGFGECVPASFFPSGEQAVTGGNRGAAVVWRWGDDASFTLQHQSGGLVRATISPDGKLIATTGDEGALRLWSAQGVPVGKELRGHPPGPLMASFAPDSASVVTGSEDGSAKLWPMRPGAAPIPLEGHSATIRWVEFSPRGTLLVTASDDATARVWRSNGQLVATLSGHSLPIYAATFDGRSRALTASGDGTARLWTHEGKLLGVLEGHAERIVGARFSVDGSHIVTAGWDSRAILWSSVLGQPLRELLVGSGVTTAAFMPQKGGVVTGSTDGRVLHWPDTGTVPRVLRSAGPGVILVSPSLDGRRILAVSKQAIATWDAETGRPISEVPVDEIREVALAPARDRLAGAGLDHSVRIWDLASGEVAGVLAGHGPGPVFPQFSPDGARVATTSRDGLVRIWEAVGGKLLDQVRAPTPPFGPALFSRAGSQLFFADSDGKIRSYDLQKHVLRDLGEHRGRARAATVSPDGTRLLTTGDDRTGRLWDVATGATVAVLSGHTATPNEGAFSGDGNLVITGDDAGSLRLWSSRSGQSVAVLDGQQDGITEVTFSGDGRQVLAASSDGTARIHPATLEGFLELACGTIRHRPQRFADSIARCAAPIRVRGE